MLNTFILGTALPSWVAVRTLPAIWATRGLLSRSGATSGSRSSKRSTWRPENMTSPQLGAHVQARAGAEVGGQGEHLEGGLAHLGRQGVEGAGAGDAGTYQACLVGGDGVGRGPVADLLARAVAGGVRGRMARDAVGDGVQ